MKYLHVHGFILASMQRFTLKGNLYQQIGAHFTHTKKRVVTQGSKELIRYSRASPLRVNYLESLDWNHDLRSSEAGVASLGF